MRAWRLALGRFPELDGEGARLYGGRWNSPGTPMVYAATHLALALLEQLVHLSPERLPRALRAFAIELPPDAGIEHASLATDDAEVTRRFGDAWVASRRAAAIAVPSVLVPERPMPGELVTEERNVLLNPRHASAASWRVVETEFTVDPRLKRSLDSHTSGGIR